MPNQHQKPLRIVNSLAPTRICDNGGWTDTWFAKHGKVFNIAVYPYAEVQLRVFPNYGEKAQITIHAENYGQQYTIEKPEGSYDKHPLLEAAIDFMRIPCDVSIEVSIHCQAPAGCSTGTSAAVSVALIGALDCLTPGRLSPHEVAMAALKIETELLGQQCGVQDQLTSVYGGINYIEMHEYPHATASPIHVPEAIWWELESRLGLIFVGETHSSSKVHESVIAGLAEEGPDCPRLERLRQTPAKSRDALSAGDFVGLGAAMIENTEAQGNLHSDLIGPRHQKIIDVARAHGVPGWKVNGAGGDGGSVTILFGPDRAAQRAILREIEHCDPTFKNIPIHLARFGLRIWEPSLDLTAPKGRQR